MISILFIGLYLVTFQVTCEGAPGPKIIIQNDVEKRASEYISILAYIYTSWLIEPSLKLLWVKWQDLNYKFLIGGSLLDFFHFRFKEIELYRIIWRKNHENLVTTEIA